MVASRKVRYLDPNSLAALGLVLSKSSQVEYTLRLLLKDIHGKGFEAGMKLTEGISNFDAIKNVWLAMKDGKIDKVANFSEQDSGNVESLIERRACAWAGTRNSIHHSLWMADSETDELITTCKMPPQDQLKKFNEETDVLLDKVDNFRRTRFHGRGT